ncbi:hypothetical protein [Levilactobacillus namurensis]|nr:hypothetical protein [Levilactobacillus namurensis]
MVKKVGRILGGIWENSTLATLLELVVGFFAEGILRHGSGRRKK